MVLAFTTVLLIEKIIADDHHHHSEEEKHARRTTIKAIKESQQMAESENHEVINETGKNKPQDSDLQHGPKMIAHSFDISQNTEPSPGAMKKKLLAENPNPVILEEDEMEEAFKDVMRTASRIAKRITIVQNTRKRTESHDRNCLFEWFIGIIFINIFFSEIIRTTKKRICLGSLHFASRDRNPCGECFINKSYLNNFLDF